MLLIHNAFFLSATYAQDAKPVGRIFESQNNLPVQNVDCSVTKYTGRSRHRPLSRAYRLTRP